MRTLPSGFVEIHDYEPGDARHPMHTDPLCAVCGLPATSLAHQRPWPRYIPRRGVAPCPCECNSGGFCGGCGHAGCGGRR